LVKIRNITSCEQVETSFRFLAYLAWNNDDYSQKDREGNRPLALSSSSINISKNSRRKRGLYRGSSASMSDSSQLITGNELDMTLIPSTCGNNINDLMVNPNNSSNDSSLRIV